MLLSAAAAWAFISFDTRGRTTQSPVMPVSVRIWWISSAARRSKGDSIVVRPTQVRDGSTNQKSGNFRVVESGKGGD
jgi:hypothetical protein